MIRRSRSRGRTSELRWAALRCLTTLRVTAMNARLNTRLTRSRALDRAASTRFKE
jgi:hypothetical protein